jgi:hypothetical protein
MAMAIRARTTREKRKTGMNANVPSVVPLFPGQSNGVATLEERAERIRRLRDMAGWCIVEMGRELIAASDEIDRGDWKRWLRDEFAWSDETARKYMSVANAFGGQSGWPRDGQLTIDASALYVLSSPDVPQPARDEAVERARAGKHITKKEADEMVRQALAAKAEEHEQVLQAAIDEVTAQQAKVVRKAIAEAKKQFSGNRAELEARLERISREAEKPDANAIAKAVCTATGAKKMSDGQWQLLAQMLNQGISVGGRTYAPVSREEMAENEEKLRIASSVTEAVQALSSAPPASELLAACYPVQRAILRDQLDTISAWVTGCRRALKAYSATEEV